MEVGPYCLHGGRARAVKVYLTADTRTLGSHGEQNDHRPAAAQPAPGGLRRHRPVLRVCRRAQPARSYEVLLHGLAFLGVTGASWGYVFGIYMGRKEVVTLGLALNAGYLAFGVWQATVHPWLGLLLLAIGGYGLGALLYYRKLILEV